MKIIRVILCLLIVTALAFIPVSSVSAAATIYEQLGAAGDGDSADIYGANVCAEIFTVASAHTVSAVMIELKKTGTLTGYVKVSLRSVAAGVPTSTELSVGYIDVDDITTTYAWYQADITDYSLSETDYAIVVSYTAGTNANYVEWHDDAGGGGAATGYALHSTDTGFSWTSDTPHDLMTKIYGTIVFQVAGANVFEDYLEDGDWLITVDCINDYPEYSGEYGVSRYFNVQILNVAGTAVIGATTLKSWGRSPCAIYLNATSVIPLTTGSAYIIRMIGTFIGTPSTTYVLTADDYVGDDLRYLDEWSLDMAKRMNEYDGNTSTNPYTTKDTVGGQILSTSGGADFVIGIPDIMNVRPNLFEVVVTQPDYDTGTATNTYDSAHTWQEQVGTTIAGDAAVFGTVLGVSAKQFLQLGIWVIYIGAMLFLFASSKGSEAVFAMVICVPVLLAGMHFRLIEAYIVGVMAAVGVLIFVIKMWFTK